MAKRLLRILFVAILYFLIARLSLILEFQSSNATPVWPASGFALAMILLMGYEVAPGIALGAFAANLVDFFLHHQTNLPAAILLSLVICIGNTGEALTGFYLLRKLLPSVQDNNFFLKARHVFRFSLTALLMCLVSSSIGASAILLSGNITSNLYSDVWFTWWLGDVAGVLIVTPLILIWSKSVQNEGWKLNKPLEAFLFFLSVILVSEMVFNNWLINNFIFSRAFWVMPMLLWGAFRLPGRKAVTATAISAIIAVWGTVMHRGPFITDSLNDSLLTLQIYLSIVSIMVLIINATIDEQRQAQAAVVQARNELESRVEQRTKELANSNLQLQRQKELVETMLDSSVDLIMSFDREMCITSFNKKCEQELHLKREDVIGKKILEVFPNTMNSPRYHDFISALKGIPVHNSLYESVETAGRYYENFIIPLRGDQNEVYGALAVAHDITEIKMTNDKLNELNKQLDERKTFAETIIDSNVDVIGAYDKNLRIISINKKFEEQFKLKKEELLGKGLLEIFPNLKDSETLVDIHKALNGETIHYTDRKYSTLDGYFDSYMIPLQKGDGEIYAVLTIVHDITEQKRAEIELKQKTEELQKKNEELFSFTYVASHDLQEPLRKIQTFTEFIFEKEKTLSESGKEYFRRIQIAARRMQQLIEDLLIYSRTSASEKHFVKSNLNTLLAQVKEDLKEKILASGGIIESTALPDLYIIPFQFKQLLTNLISNSIKFSRPNVPPKISIESNVINSSEIKKLKQVWDEKYFHLTITDNGVGFESEYNDLVFGLFQRLHGMHKYEGTGIGLAICKKIVENHEGIITAEGNPDKGAVFNIYLPVSIVRPEWPSGSRSGTTS